MSLAARDATGLVNELAEGDDGDIRRAQYDAGWPRIQRTCRSQSPATPQAERILGQRLTRAGCTVPARGSCGTADGARWGSWRSSYIQDGATALTLRILADASPFGYARHVRAIRDSLFQADLCVSHASTLPWCCTSFVNSGKLQWPTTATKALPKAISRS